MCRLCDCEGCFYVTICDKCGVPIVILTAHRAEFTEGEKDKIRSIFPRNKIRWEMRSITDHAHAHIEGLEVW